MRFKVAGSLRARLSAWWEWDFQIGKTKYVERFVEGFRTGVQFPPPPPNLNFKQYSVRYIKLWNINVSELFYCLVCIDWGFGDVYKKLLQPSLNTDFTGILWASTARCSLVFLVPFLYGSCLHCRLWLSLHENEPRYRRRPSSTISCLFSERISIILVQIPFCWVHPVFRWIIYFIY